MNNKKQLTKVSVLIDKLNYLNDNMDYNNLKDSDVDFKLLKNYALELVQLLNEPIAGQAVVVEKSAAKEQQFTNTAVDKAASTAPEAKPLNVVPKKAFEKSTSPNAFDLPPKNVQEQTIYEKFIPQKDKEELDQKNARENIFDTVNAIKKQKLANKIIPSVKHTSYLAKPEVQKEAANTEKLEIKEPKAFDFTPKPEKEIINPKETIVEVKQPTPPHPIADEAETDEEGTPSLNDRFKNEEHNLANTVQPKSTRNFKELIDINDRFLFIQSLFGGSYLAFEETVKHINHIENYSEALDYVDYKLKDAYNWSFDSEEVAKFLNILEKSYS